MAVVMARENTFNVDLRNFPKRPSYEEVHRFIHEIVGLQPNQILRLQMNHAQNCAHVKCADLNTALIAVERNNERHQLEIDGKSFPVRLVMDNGCIEVKIHDLSENISNDQVATFLRQYGEILQVTELTWSRNFPFGGIPSGVRVATMILHRHIKSFVRIRGEKTLISYSTQPQQCRHCGQPLHTGQSCVQNKKSSTSQNVQNTTNEDTSHSRKDDGSNSDKIGKTEQKQKIKQQRERAKQDRKQQADGQQIIESPPRKKPNYQQSDTCSDTSSRNNRGAEMEMDPINSETDEEPSDADEWIVWVEKKYARKAKPRIKFRL